MPLENIHACLSDKRDADKVKAIILLAKGWSYPQTEEALLINERTIRRYRETFIKGGIELLLENKYKGGFCRLRAEEKKYVQKKYVSIFIPVRRPHAGLFERLWRYMKREVQSNRYYQTYNDFLESITGFLRQRSKKFRKNLSSLMKENFHFFPFQEH